MHDVSSSALIAILRMYFAWLKVFAPRSAQELVMTAIDLVCVCQLMSLNLCVLLYNAYDCLTIIQCSSYSAKLFQL